MNENLLFDYYDEKYDKKFTAGYRDKNTQPLYHQFPTVGGDNPSIPVPTAALASKDGQQGTEVSGPVDAQQGCTCIKWHGYDIQSIIDARFAAKLPCKDDQNRHAESLKLATDLLLMFDGDKQTVLRIVEAQPWVQEIIDERDENVEQTVESAAAHKRKQEEKVKEPWPSNAMQEAVLQATGKTYQEITKQTAKVASQIAGQNDIDAMLWQWGEQIEAMGEYFPAIKDMMKGLKHNQYPAALFVATGLMMTLMTRCTYRFYHRPEELRRLNNSTIIIGDPASGKSFATRLFKLLSAPIDEADQVGIEAINAYRELMRTKGANKEKPKRPKVVIRIHPARTSNAQFIQDMVNAKEEVDGTEMQLHMLTFDTELDNTLTVQKGGSWIDKQSLQLKAFHNEEDGQAYSNNDSVFQKFFVVWNYIYTGTPLALKKMVNEQNFGSGMATRLTVIPLPATNFEMLTRESHVDLESDTRLKEWAYKLDRTKGELSLQKIVNELYDWTARRMADAKENNSKADEMLLKRCAYHGVNFAAPLIMMRHWDQLNQDGKFWCGTFETDDIDWQLVELIVTIQYACQRHYFGAMADNYFDNKLRDASVNIRRSKATIEGFNRLPEEFTSEDVMRCYNVNNLKTAQMKIFRLQKDHIVEKMEDFNENGHTKSRYRKIGTIL